MSERDEVSELRLEIERLRYAIRLLMAQVQPPIRAGRRGEIEALLSPPAED